MKTPLLTKYSKLPLTFFTCLLIFTLTGCGFHLRRPATLPPELQTIIIMPDTVYTPLQREITQQLEMAGSFVVESSKEAVILTLLNENFTETTLSVGSDGQAREKRLLYTLFYQLTDQQGNMLIDPSLIKLDHVIKYDPNFVLAKSYEGQKMINGMRIDAVSQLLTRLSKLVVSSIPVANKVAATPSLLPLAGEGARKANEGTLMQEEIIEQAND